MFFPQLKLSPPPSPSNPFVFIFLLSHLFKPEAGGNPRRGEAHRGVQAREPGYVQLGDPG